MYLLKDFFLSYQYMYMCYLYFLADSMRIIEEMKD